MADAVLLDSYRERIAAHMAGKGTLKPIGYVAFGDGGHDRETMLPIPPEETDTGLKHEVLRKPVTLITQEDSLSVTGRGTVENNELLNIQLSEAALLDTDGNFIAIKCFAPKIKESDERYEIAIKLRF